MKPMMKLKRKVRGALNSLGLEICRHVPRVGFKDYLDMYGVDAIFDIGAYNGSSGEYYRNIGFEGKIVSFEPVNALFATLSAKAEADPLWSAENHALGDENTTTTIHVSGGPGASSSMLEMTENLKTHAANQRYVDTQEIEVRTLDSVMDAHYPKGDRLFLKLDVQGFEKQVLLGAAASLPRVVGLQVEMSIKRNYEGEPLYSEMIPYIESLGFSLVHIENGWSNERTGEMYQIDGIFYRTDKR